MCMCVGVSVSYGCDYTIWNITVRCFAPSHLTPSHLTPSHLTLRYLTPTCISALVTSVVTFSNPHFHPCRSYLATMHVTPRAHPARPVRLVGSHLSLAAVRNGTVNVFEGAVGHPALAAPVGTPAPADPRVASADVIGIFTAVGRADSTRSGGSRRLGWF